MPLTKRLTIESVNLDDDDAELDAIDDQVVTAGLERVRTEGDELRRRGILDAQGNMLLKELQTAMKEGEDRDFGG